MRPRRRAAANAIERIRGSKKRKVNDGVQSSANGPDGSDLARVENENQNLMNGLDENDPSNANRLDGCRPETNTLADGSISDEKRNEISTESAEAGNGANDAAVDGFGLNLHLAVKNQDKRHVKRLLKSGANPNALDDSGLTPLHQAVRLRDVNLIQLLLDVGADVNHRGGSSSAQPIIHEAINLEPHHATKAGRLAIIKKLISHGANVKAVDSKGRSALYCATSSVYSSDYNDLLQLLINHGANPHIRPHPDTKLSYPFVNVLEEGDLASVRLFLTRFSKSGVTLARYARSRPLHRACHNVNNPEVLEFLLASGLFDVNQFTSTSKEAPLHKAVRYNNPDAVEILLDWGADVNIVHEPTGSTPLHMVEYSSSASFGTERKLTERCVQLLLDHGANVDAIQRCSGKTALEVGSDMARFCDDDYISLPLARSDHVLARIWQRKCLIESSIATRSRDEIIDLAEMMSSDDEDGSKFYRVSVPDTLRMNYHEELNVMKTVQIKDGVSMFDLLLDESGRFWDEELETKLLKSEMSGEMMQFSSYAGRLLDWSQRIRKKRFLEEEAIEKLSELFGLEKGTFQFILQKIVRNLSSRDLQALTYDPNV